MKNYITTLGIAVTLALPHAAQAQGVTPPPVPAYIEVDVVVEPEASAGSVSFMKLNVSLDPFTLWPVKGAGPATSLAIRSEGFLPAPKSRRSGTRARSKKRIVAGATAGGVGVFLRADFSAPISKVIGVTAMTPACAAS